MNAEPDCIKLLGEHRRRETFEVGGHRFVDFLSHGTVLEDCTLTIRGSSRGVVFHGYSPQLRDSSEAAFHELLLARCAVAGVYFQRMVCRV